MGLRTKIFLVLFALTAAVFVGQMAVMKKVVFPQFVQLEEKSARRNMARIRQAVTSELNNLDILCHDWAVWDDAADFVEGRGNDFVRINIPEQFFGVSHIDYLSFFNVKGDLIYHRAIDPLTGQEFAVEGMLDGEGKDVLRFMLADREVHGEDLMKSGLLYADNIPEPLLLISRPIYPSNHKGDLRGTLIMGRFLRNEPLQQKIGVDLIFQPLAEIQRTGENLDVLNALLSGSETPVLRYLNESIYFYGLQNNIYGEPLCLIVGQRPAEITRHGEGAIHASMVYYLFVSILFLLAVFFLMSGIVTGPIRSLCKQIRIIVQRADFSLSIKGTTSGEIGDLNRDINDLLVRIRAHEKLLSEANDKLRKQSLTDVLTGLANRRSFDTYMENEWGRLRRSRKPLSVIMCDVDYFKKYNDAYGHLKGDTCLQALATAIAGSCHRPADLPARYGGEEFVVVLPETGTIGALHVAERICTMVRELQIEHVGSTVYPVVTMSIGLASMVPDREHDTDYLLKIADEALYLAKGAGRNRVVVFKES